MTYNKGVANQAIDGRTIFEVSGGGFGLRDGLVD